MIWDYNPLTLKKCKHHLIIGGLGIYFTFVQILSDHPLIPDELKHHFV